MNIRTLMVGDMHVVPEELEDCSKLLEHVLEVAKAEDLHEVWFSGDQHHTHAVVRLEVMHWWKNAFTALRKAGLEVTCLVGNHDQLSPGSPIHAMMAYDGVNVVDRPQGRDGILMLPYFHTQEEFLAAANVPGTKTLVCHQTFDGSTYENGFLASDGFDPNLLQQELVISGHIHTGQEFGKVWYVGAPRWRTLSDANVERAVWALEFQDGALVSRKPYSTGEVCRQIRFLEDSPKKPVQLPLDLRHQWRVDVKGPADWCQKRKLELAAAGARVRVFPTQVSQLGRVRESEGIEQAFRSFMGAYTAKHGTPGTVLEAMVKEYLR